MTSAADFRKLDPREHVLLRPGMYIGSVEPERATHWCLASSAAGDDDRPRMERREVTYVPALHKIADEIFVNARDQVAKLQAAIKAGVAGVQPVRRIDVTLDRATGYIEVRNDGDGVPVELHAGTGIYVPELVFGHLLSGSNFEDADEETAGGANKEAKGPKGAPRATGRTTGGQNGIGAKATNIFSKEFVVETVDARAGKRYRQRFRENMQVIDPPEIRASGKVKPFTLVRFLPDYARLRVPSGLLDEDAHALLVRRVYDLPAVLPPDVQVWLDGERLAHRTFAAYVDLFLGGSAAAVEAVAEGWDVAAGLSDGGGLQQVSFVNGVATPRGGKHVDHVVQQICRRVGEMIEARKKGCAVKAQYIRDNLFVFVRATVPDPTFDSQTKETLTTPASRFGAKVELSDRFIEKLYKAGGLVERVVGLSEAATTKAATKTDGSKRSTVSGLPKLEDAEWAGTARSGQCTLILTEGDSAKASALAGLAVVGRERWGVYPLRGKIMNVCEVAADRVNANAEIAALKKILGLQAGRVYASAAELRYGRVMIMTDADHDGSHIRGLLFNLFHRLWPSLLRVPGFFAALLTPVVKATRGREQLAFYNVTEYERWRE